MCYAHPGPRCSSHAEGFVKTAVSEYESALNSGDMDKAFSLRTKVKDAYDNYYMTPAGQKMLESEISKTGDPTGELSYSLEYGIECRKVAIQQLNHTKNSQELENCGTDTSSRVPQNVLAGKNNHPALRARKDAVKVESDADRLDREHAEKIARDKEELDNINSLRKIKGLRPISTLEGHKNLKLDDEGGGYGSYDASLIPQADKLEKIGAVVESVKGGAVTAGSIAESIDMQDRGGSYYANAAEYLGLVKKVEAEYGGNEFVLTPNGEAYYESDAAGRAAIMKEMVNATPIMKAYTESGNDKEVLADHIRSAGEGGYEESTTGRRVNSLISWHNTLNSEEFSSKLGSSDASAKLRSVSAAERLKSEREAKAKLNKKPEIKDYGTCMECFMKLPASGVCGCQD